MKLSDILNISKKERVITRIAPSPTGPLHVGTARTALFNYLFAKHHKGQFIVRIEDTDTERSKKEFETDIIENLAWLGLSHDALYRQSDRKDIYRTYLDSIISDGKAYVSKEKRKDKPDESIEVIRLKNPNKKIVFTDIIRGEISFDTAELGDFVIARNIDSPLYHFTVVVDDYEMKISHIIRGEDHISNTPRQILIQEALDLIRPKYAHIPLILAPDRSKLSKRHGAISLTEYRKIFLPEAMINYLALLGWNPGTEQELFSLQELIKTFDLSRVQKGGAIFDEEKLISINKQYIKKISNTEFKKNILNALPESITSLNNFNEALLDKIVPIIRERVNTFAEISDLIKTGELDYFFSRPAYNPKDLLWKKDTTLDIVATHLHAVIGLLELTPHTDFTEEKIREAVWKYAEEHGKGSVLWPMRFALTGKEKSPDPFIVASILGKKEVLERLHVAHSNAQI